MIVTLSAIQRKMILSILCLHPFIPTGEKEYISAYEYQMDNINYTVETWTFNQQRGDFLCRDGGIVAFADIEFDEWRYYFITRYETEADTDLIQLPDDAVIFKHSMEDDTVTTEYLQPLTQKTLVISSVFLVQ